MDGIVVLDKPRGISSHDAVQKVRRLLGTKRVGHLGTLDPIGTGVLPLVVGQATRLSQFFLRHERAYDALIRFGFATDSYDADGDPITETREAAFNEEQVEAALASFRGPLLQTPPPVSAKKIGGVPAYKLARRNKPVRLEPVAVEVYELKLLAVEGDRARVSVRCSAGTYVRSLAHELGEALGAGAHVAELRRTAMGEFTLEMARTLEELEELRAADRLGEALIPPDRELPDLHAARVDEMTATQIAHGRDFRISAFGSGKGAQRVKAIDPTGRLVAIGEIRLPLVYHPIVVL
jgi:tRNA pseudouridine55 synthase